MVDIIYLKLTKQDHSTGSDIGKLAVLFMFLCCIAAVAAFSITIYIRADILLGGKYLYISLKLFLKVFRFIADDICLKMFHNINV